MSRYAARRMQTKNVAFAFVVALVASLLIWTPSWQNPWAVASGDLGYDSEVDYYAGLDGSSSWRGGQTQPIALASDFSVEAWIYPTNLSGTRGWVAQGGVRDNGAYRFSIGTIDA